MRTITTIQLKTWPLILYSYSGFFIPAKMQNLKKLPLCNYIRNVKRDAKRAKREGNGNKGIQGICGTLKGKKASTVIVCVCVLSMYI